MFRQTALSLLAVTSTSFFAMPASADITLRTLAVTGEPAPGLGGDFTNFSYPQINASGQVVFIAATSADGDTGVWRTPYDDPNQLDLLVRTGDAVPDAQGAIFGYFDTFGGVRYINDLGNVALGLRVLGGQDPVSGLFRIVDDTLETVALPGLPAPGAGPDVVFSQVTPWCVFSNSNAMAFDARIEGPGINWDNNYAGFAHGFGGLNLILREGGAAPHINGMTISDNSLGFEIADDGRLAIRATVTDGNDNYGALWTGWPGLLDLVAAPGGDPDFDMVTTPALDDHGVTFSGAAGNSGIWRWTSGEGTTSVALSGGPGPIAQTSYEAIGWFSIQTNRHGAVTFPPRLSGGGITEDDDTMIVLRVPGEAPQVIFREGDPAPGYWNDVVFDDLTNRDTFIDDDGRMYFRAPLRGAAITEGNDNALYVRYPDGTLDIVIREGGIFEVRPGDYRFVERFSIADGVSTAGGSPPAVTDEGDAAMRVDFTDGSEAIVVLTNPAPCVGDFNDDGTRDVTDMLILLANYGGPAPMGENGDTDKDGFVDVDDLLGLVGNWGPCP